MKTHGLPRLAALFVLGVAAACSTAQTDSPALADREPPPPPAPAPPPPPPPQAAAERVVITGSRVATQGFSAIVPAYVPYVGAERYEDNEIASIAAVADQPVSTFSVDVDTGAYANVRRFLMQGIMPPRDAVRTEEMINYFRYDYPKPEDRSQPFSVTVDMARTPWNEDTRLMRVGLRGYDLDYRERPPANLVFLVDVSGSMQAPDKLPLVQTALSMLADNLRPEDRVSIVVYAGAAGVVLEPTNDPDAVKAALARLAAGGSTAGGEGLALAYATARASFREDGINRILIATDGDFNVGVTNQEQLEEMIERNRESGITLTTLGFGEDNYNEALMESIADLGNGNYAYIDSAMEARKVLDEEMASTLFTIARDVKVQVEFNPAFVSEYRLIGYENRLLAEEDFDNDAVDAGDIGASHQVTAFYEIVPAGVEGWMPERRYEANRTEAGPAHDADSTELAFVQLRYKLPDGDESTLIEHPVAVSLLDGAGAPSGDFAFGAAVAAFGQSLRGDELLHGFTREDIERLAGPQDGYWREEFLELVKLAGTQAASLD